MSQQLVNYEEINGKEIAVFDDHASAIIPWAKARLRTDQSPILLTLDHHTDTKSAFACHISNSKNGSVESLSEDEWEKEIMARVTQCNIQNESELRGVLATLKHDEHIDFAIRSKILSHSFSITHSSGGSTPKEIAEFKSGLTDIDRMKYNMGRIKDPLPPYTYVMPKNRMFEVESGCVKSCKKLPHDDVCQLECYDMSIDDCWLGEKLRIADHMNQCVTGKAIIESTFILDIDLDLFHTEKSVNPISHETFYQLIRSSEYITIAKEPQCVNSLKAKGESITSDTLLKRVLEHIDHATQF